MVIDGASSGKRKNGASDSTARPPAMKALMLRFQPVNMPMREAACSHVTREGVSFTSQYSIALRMAFGQYTNFADAACIGIGNFKTDTGDVRDDFALRRNAPELKEDRAAQRVEFILFFLVHQVQAQRLLQLLDGDTRVDLIGRFADT